MSSCSLRVWLDTTPPAITFTSPGPGTNTVNQPILQLQGSAPEELASVTFDTANSAGCLTDQPGIVLSRFNDSKVDVIEGVTSASLGGGFDEFIMKKRDGKWSATKTISMKTI